MTLRNAEEICETFAFHVSQEKKLPLKTFFLSVSKISESYLQKKFCLFIASIWFVFSVVSQVNMLKWKKSVHWSCRQQFLKLVFFKLFFLSGVKVFFPVRNWWRQRPKLSQRRGNESRPNKDRATERPIHHLSVEYIFDLAFKKNSSQRFLLSPLKHFHLDAFGVSRVNITMQSPTLKPTSDSGI